ncbi:MAG: beta-glucuronidase [Planctomycetota bacterium]|nr:beta-glucuronidase [Planctomycetota bacterium]
MIRPQANRLREEIDLSGFWQFDVDPEKKGQDIGWPSGFSSGKAVAVPASFNEQFQAEDFPEVDIKNYMGTVWYQKRFFVPAGWAGRRIYLHVGAASYHAKVWVNGKFLGEHKGGFFPFQFDATDAAGTGEENLLVISLNGELDEHTLPVGLPAGPMTGSYPPVCFDYFPYGGIHRPVILQATAKNFIDDVSVKTEIEATTGKVHCQVAAGGGDAVRISIADAPETAVELPVKAGLAEGHITVDNARLWCPKDPHLYRLRVELLAGGQAVDEYTLAVGIRTIRVEGDKLLLNGKPVFLRGTGKHEDFPILGKGLCRPQIVKDYALLRWLGANAFRCVHYPYSDEMMDMADREGMLVVGEVPAVGLDWKVLTPQLLEVHKEFIRKTIDKDKNRPSVIMWCVANEPMDLQSNDIYREPTPEVEGYFREVCRHARSLDDRPVTIADCTRRGEKILQHCDVVSLNRYYGWYHLPARLDEGLDALSKELDRYYDLLKKPILLSEFGADSVAGLHFDPPELWTEEFQAKMIEETIKVAETKPYLVGTLIWSFADFKTAQVIWRVVCNRKGIFTRDRQPKLAAHRVRDLWKNKR